MARGVSSQGAHKHAFRSDIEYVHRRQLLQIRKETKSKKSRRFARMYHALCFTLWVKGKVGAMACDLCVCFVY